MFLKSVNIDEKKCRENVQVNMQTDVSVQPTGKWIERISQSECALRQTYVINRFHSLSRHYGGSACPLADN